eukprot:jgi/Mesvir1/25310/Mv20376-RA.1
MPRSLIVIENRPLMSDDNFSENSNKTTRRDFVTLTASSLAAVGVACSAWPLVDSLNPSADVLALSSIEVDISSIEPGHTMTVKWRGKPVFIRNRTEEEIKEARETPMSALVDPQEDSARVKAGHDKWLITIGICTHLGCVPLANKVKDFVGFGIYLLIFAYFIFYKPNLLGHPDNYIPANPLVTPAHIVPECNHNLYYRNLKDIGFSEAEIKQLAQKYTVKDGPNAEGEMFDRPALPSDRFVSPYPNEEAARAANNGAYPVDLSLIIKARQDGPNYVFSLLSGYQDAPADVKLMPGLYYNPYFEGGQIAMPPPLTEGQVTFSDGTPATVEQMAKDVVVFLQWAAEPEMEHRKSMGLKAYKYCVPRRY